MKADISESACARCAGKSGLRTFRFYHGRQTSVTKRTTGGKAVTISHSQVNGEASAAICRGCIDRTRSTNLIAGVIGAVAGIVLIVPACRFIEGWDQIPKIRIAFQFLTAMIFLGVPAYLIWSGLLKSKEETGAELAIKATGDRFRGTSNTFWTPKEYDALRNQ